MRSALFVDFDNVYSGLRKFDQASADRFASQPLQWMNWVVDSLALPDHVPVGARRRVLVRRCYLNPQAYQRFRPAFNLAGFEIIDCPALTSDGKTSTDIHMVLDMIDLLQHETRYDEFIVFSADADFTPVLRKLRRSDRRTTVLAIGFPSAAYRASADLLIDQDDFVRQALGFRDDDEPPALTPASLAGDPARAALAGTPNVANVANTLDAPASTIANELAAITQLIQREVGKASQPVLCSRIASLIAAQHSAVAADWNGKGVFRRFIDTLELSPLKFDWRGAGGCVYDPGRHKLSSEGSNRPGSAGVPAPDWADQRDLLPIATQIHEVTSAPLLRPQDYRALFNLIESDLAEQPFDPNDTARRVRDRCRDAEHPVSRADVAWVLRGLLMRGHVFGNREDDAQVLSRKTANNVRSLCLREQMMVDEATDKAIARWIEGGI